MIIGVAGSGVMGGGIAQMFAENGFQVLVWDVTNEAASRGVQKIAKRLESSVAKGKLPAETATEITARIGVAEDLQAFAPAVLVIEAVIENMEQKQQLYRKLEEVLSPEAVIGTNTSSLSVAGLAEGLTHPERFLGIHFFNPPTKLELVELVAIPGLNADVLTNVREILGSCGKTTVAVKDSAGFIVNRLLLPFINEAAKLVDEGVASPQDIDTAMVLGTLHPAGPLQVADLIGLDVCAHILDVLAEAADRPEWRPADSIRELVAAGKLGRKTGEGFHRY